MTPAPSSACRLEQRVGVGGDADRLHVGQHEGQRQLELGEQRAARRRCSSSASKASARSRDRRGPHRLGLGERVVGLVEAAVEGELAGLLDVAAQLAVQVAQRQVGQVEGALVGPQQVGRQLGVAGDAGQIASRAGAAPAAGP